MYYEKISIQDDTKKILFNSGLYVSYEYQRVGAGGECGTWN